LKKVLLIQHLSATRCVGIVCELVPFVNSKDVECIHMETKRFNFPDTVPLVQLENGAVRVRNSRVTLETIVHRMQVGDAAEDIHDGFPTVSVTQIKEILDWYFDNKADADEYLHQVEEEGERLRQWAESQPGYKESREKLLRCREEMRRRKAQLSKA
jgi:uncharacterized protein (DUF433 family)